MSNQPTTPTIPKNTLMVGTTGKGEVCVNHPNLDLNEHGEGHIIFSPQQARQLAYLLLEKANTADCESTEGAEGGQVYGG